MYKELDLFTTIYYGQVSYKGSTSCLISDPGTSMNIIPIQDVFRYYLCIIYFLFV